jgi:O-antigen ligase
MFSPDNAMRRLQSRFAFTLMAMLLVILWISGGASRADVIGQVIARGAAWTILVALILWAPRPQFHSVAPVGVFVLMTLTLAIFQLLPLPPAVWTAFPGRELMAQAAVVSGQQQPWRPLSISPSATVNALSSLVVPAVTLVLLAGLGAHDRWRVASLLLGLAVASSLLGLVQFSGESFNHPLVNDIPGAVSGSFANRNHFALFAAIGCLLAPTWGFRQESKTRWQGPVSLAMLLLFLLMILASGSRMGLIVGVLGTGLGILNVWRTLLSEIRRLPRPIAIASVSAAVALLIAGIGLSLTWARAVSLNRAVALDAGEDLRVRAFPTVWAMTKDYFPFGTGIGTFDPAYRIHEPDGLLSLAYFNHAHNDLLEVILDTGVFGVVLSGSAIIWWLTKSFAAWRSTKSSDLLPRLGAATLLLILVASATDYPARTPMIMAVVVIGAVWLNGRDGEHSTSAHRSSRDDRSQPGRT